MPAKVSLPEVTICAADSAFVDLTAQALSRSMELCDFGDAILFSDVAVSGPFRHIEIGRLDSIEAYSRFCLQSLPDFLRTPFVLVVQWDGYVVDAAVWRREFLKYDYIGAPWAGQPENRAVGNGGFSLRSRRLMRAVQKMPRTGGYPEDFAICHFYRAILRRDHAIRFAPVKVAEKFSSQFEVDHPTFGFHGLSFLAKYLNGADVAAVAAQLDVDKVDSDKLLDFALACLEADHLDGARGIYERLARKHPSIIIKRVLEGRYGAPAAEQSFASLEALRFASPSGASSPAA